ncbi:MAG: SpoIIE family protein phosphatase [Ignavibacteriaceae bacterium]|nr:SpoIIE family protein phosphatase [Ignavibacteriaceae bacterium]
MKRILIVEDDPAISKALCDALNVAGYDTRCIEDGLEGLNTAKAMKPDLLLLDVMLPSMNGFEICTALRVNGYTFPVFMLTSLTEEARRMQGLETGADEYISKPFSIKELLLRIKNTLNREEKLRERSAELENEIAKAREIQLKSLPGKAPDVPGLEIYGTMIPAETVGGDYYDYIQLSEGRTGIIIADVCGKGLAAAMLVQKLQGVVCSFTGAGVKAGEMAKIISERMKDGLPKGGFITFAIAVYDPGNHSVELVRAGHLPFLFSGKEGVKEIKPAGLWLGPMPSKAFGDNIVVENITINKNDLLIMITDGVTECVNEGGEEYGLERLKPLLTSFGSVAERILNELNTFRGSVNLKDDTTLIVIKGT